MLQILVASRDYSSVFEIGTFNGGTTRLLAEALPADGRVCTIDLPRYEFDATQGPLGFTGDDVGRAYKDSNAAHKITQLRGDTLTYDFSPHYRSADLVLVDGAHDYAHGFSDSQAALKIVKPGGIVLWDDFEPYWHGLVNGIADAVSDDRLRRIAGTSLAIYTLAAS